MRLLHCAVVSMIACASVGARAADPGVTPTSITLGGSYPMSGISAVLGVNISAGAKAYFALVNDRGGVKGRSIRFTALDDGYDPARVVGNMRRLVESEGVFAIFNVGGTAHNLAIRGYLNDAKVPHLFLNTGDPQFGNIEDFPWTVPWLPSYDTEMMLYANYIKKTKKDATIAVLYQNDTYGKAGLASLERAAAQVSLQIVARESYLPSDPTVDTPVGKLARSRADVFVDIAIPKFAAQAIRRLAALDWKPLHILELGSASGDLVLRPAGVQESQGIVSAAFLKDPGDPAMSEDAGVREYREGIRKYAPSANPLDPFVVRGWAAAQTMVKTLEAASSLTREAVVTASRNLDADVPMMLVRLHSTPTQPFPIDSLVLERFTGDRFVLDGTAMTPVVAPQ